MSDFERALARVLLFEGGKVDDPADAGGRTNQGVTQRIYDSWRDAHLLARQDVFLITADEVKEIYCARFWIPSHADSLNWPLNLILFDCAVNSGPVQAQKLLQRAARSVPQDGIIGPKTLASIQVQNIRQLCQRFLLERVFFYNHLDEGHPEWTKFLTGGWLKRIESLYRDVP